MKPTITHVALLAVAFIGVRDIQATAPPISPSMPVPIFDLKFDQSVAHQGELKVTDVKTSGQITFEAGIVGESLAVEDGTIEYMLAEPLNMKEGTIALWFRPAEWDDASFFEFIRGYLVEDGKRQQLTRTRIYIQPHHWRGLAVLRYLPAGTTNLFCNRSYVDWWRKDPQKWRQFVLTWKDGEGVLYIDGLQAAADSEFQAGVDFGNRIRIGGETYRYDEARKRISTHGKTLFDEVRIYKEAISPEQVLQEYEQKLGPLIQQDKF